MGCHVLIWLPGMAARLECLHLLPDSMFTHEVGYGGLIDPSAGNHVVKCPLLSPCLLLCILRLAFVTPGLDPPAGACVQVFVYTLLNLPI